MTVRRIIFLDIDGVLNSGAYFKSIHGTDYVVDPDHAFQIDPECVARLNTLVRETDAHLVLSSTWRLSPDGVDRTRRALVARGFAFGDRLFSNTASYGDEPRGREIADWLWNDPPCDVESFVILDDDDDMPIVGERLVHVNAAYGLQDRDVTRAIEHLRAPLGKGCPDCCHPNGWQPFCQGDGHARAA